MFYRTRLHTSASSTAVLARLQAITDWRIYHRNSFRPQIRGSVSDAIDGSNVDLTMLQRAIQT